MRPKKPRSPLCTPVPPGLDLRRSLVHSARPRLARVENDMARGDNRRTKKMNRRRAQLKLKARIKRRIAESKKA